MSGTNWCNIDEEIIASSSEYFLFVFVVSMEAVNGAVGVTIRKAPGAQHFEVPNCVMTVGASKGIDKM
jgi:hypothetical protein